MLNKKHRPGGSHVSVMAMIFPAVFKDVFYFVLVPPPPGGPEEGPDCHFPKEIDGFGPIPARIWGETYFLFLFWP